MLDPILPQGGYNQRSGQTSRERNAIEQALERQQENPELAMMAQKIAALEARPVYTAGLGIRINGGVIDATGANVAAGGNQNALNANDLIPVTLCRNGQPWSYSFQGIDNGPA